MLRSTAVRRGLGWAMGLVLVVSLATWWTTRERLPERIRIATALPGGQYHRLGGLLAQRLEAATGRPVELMPTAGSVENRELLLRGDAELAIFQAGAASLGGLAVLSPAHPDVVQVVVRKSAGIHEMAGLAGRRVAIGPRGSGMRRSSLELLGHYRLSGGEVELVDAYFLELEKDPGLDAAVIVTGLLNDDLGRLLRSGDYDLLPIDAEAFAVRHAFYSAVTIPRGVHAERPAVPGRDVRTVATTALLVATPEVSPLLVDAALDALHEASLREALPTIYTRTQARAWSDAPLHPEAADHLSPYRGLDTVASFMESLAAAKELLFALAAGLYLAVTRWRSLKENERRRELEEQKERLDAYVESTLEIERAQMTVSDARRLRGCLDEVTRLKIEALTELSHEDLRGDRMFLIFLTQCASLTAKIQAKLSAASAPTGEDGAGGP